MAVINLYVIIEGRVSGILSQDEAGLMSFKYFVDYDGIPLSLRMPIRDKTYDQAVVRPYLFGLLPDDDEQRKAIADEFECKANNPVALLSHIGLDCPGGVQFCQADDGAMKDALQRGGSYIPLSDHEVAQRLKSIRDNVSTSWVRDRERWSLAGMQGKFALAYHDGAWCSAQGSVPTTHIFKNGVQGFKLQALNEYACMRTAAACGVTTADVAYRFFEDECALIIARYDRVITDGVVRRLHQEDLCQALGYYPDQKYTSYGGPTTSDVLGLLTETGRHTAENLRAFCEQLFFNYLIGAPDAHAKNYSILLGRDSSYRLAPMYDVASGLVYDGMKQKMRLAMAIGGENRFGRMTFHALERFVRADDAKIETAMLSAGLDGEGACELMCKLAREIPQQLEIVLREDVAGMCELRDHLLEPVCQNCERALGILGVTA